MKFLSKYVNRKTLELTYKMHVRPHLEYGDIIFHNRSEYLMKMLDSIQYQAGIIATGCWQKTNQSKLLNELGWETLEDRRILHRLTYYYKIQNNLTLPYPKAYVLDAPLTADTLIEWNNLDPTIKDSENLNVFK